MIDYLRGKLVSFDEQSVVLEVSGVGYRFLCPDPNAFAVHCECEELVAYTHMVLKEEEAVLYGFPTSESRSLFRQLVSVTGIGPKAALSILTAGSPEEVISAILMEQVSFFTRAPGIGRKTAQRLILELKDRLPEKLLDLQKVPVHEQESEALRQDGEGIWTDVVTALTSLGFSHVEARTMVEKARRQGFKGSTADEALKLVLQSINT